MADQFAYFWHEEIVTDMTRIIHIAGVFLLLLLPTIQLSAGEARQLIREGNKLFAEGNYAEAESLYRDALRIDEDNFKALFNLGNALYKQGILDQASEIFEGLSFRTESADKEAKVLHNLGNTYLGAGNIAKGIDAYKQALRIAPDHEDTRYNLAYALHLLDEMPPENGGEPDGGEDDSQEGGNGDTTGDDNEEEGNGEEDGQVDRDPSLADGDDSPDRIDQLSPEDAERILEALRQQEQEVQENILRDVQHSEPVTSEREW